MIAYAAGSCFLPNKIISGGVSGISTILYHIFTVIVIGLTVAFGWTFSIRFANPRVEGPVGVPRVVLSGSMSYKLESNEYLDENGLDDQFDTFDLIITHELPGEFELELYDIVVYELKGELVVHRIVGIEEPNEKHPEHRLFELRGDAIKYSDTRPVEYSQMMAIYRGEHVKYVGSFVHFMQSPAGYVCILLMIVGCIISPLTDLLIRRARKNRLRLLGYYY